jgi:ubiquinone/menaquinone biosynthesis C-methylase UbiE
MAQYGTKTDHVDGPNAPSSQSWWDRHMVPRLIRCACSQGQIMKARSHIVPLAQGDVLELGCGGGINMEFYNWSKVRSFTGLDPSPQLLRMSEDAARRHQLAAKGAAPSIVLGCGEAMPFPDGSFDTVVTTFTLCSVDQPQQVLAEIRRVLRPDGQALFLEHGAAPDKDAARWQRRIEPLWKRMAGNCHLSRPISAVYRAANFAVEQYGAQYMPKTPRPFGWVEYGIARPI